MEISAISEAAAGAVEIFCWEQLVLCGNCLWSNRDLGLVIFYSSLCPQAATAALKVWWKRRSSLIKTQEQSDIFDSHSQFLNSLNFGWISLNKGAVKISEFGYTGVLWQQASLKLLWLPKDKKFMACIWSSSLNLGQVRNEYLIKSFSRVGSWRSQMWSSTIIWRKPLIIYRNDPA